MECVLTPVNVYIGELKSSNVEMTKKMSKLVEKSEKMIITNKLIGGELSTLKGIYNKLEGEYSIIEKKYNELEDTLNEMEEAYNEVGGNYVMLTEDNKELKEENEKLKEENEKLIDDRKEFKENFYFKDLEFNELNEKYIKLEIDFIKLKHLIYKG
jgi:chromosome segregation ATPase